MKNYLLRIFIVVNFINVGLTAQQLTTSVIIPCSPKHARFLHELLDLLEEQTVMPDEVVISLSEADKASPTIIDAIQQNTWKFPVTLLLFQQKCFPGENRNNACRVAKGDIFICQDADDIPHPQRVEIIKYFFEHHGVKHVAHQFDDVSKPGQERDFKMYPNLEAIPWENPSNYWQLQNIKIHNGNIALAREVFDVIKWCAKPKAEDTGFNDAVYKKFKQRAAVKACLLTYRRYLSAGIKPRLTKQDMKNVLEAVNKGLEINKVA